MKEINLKLPQSWKEVTIQMFVELNQIQTEGRPVEEVFIEQLSILTDTDSDELNKIPVASFPLLMKELDWVMTQPLKAYSETFRIGDVEYGLVPQLENLTFGEWVDLETWINESTLENLHKITALLFRPIVKRTSSHILEIKPDHPKYTIEEYNSEDVLIRAELFKKKANIEDVFGASVFFCHIGLEYMQLMRDSLMMTVAQEISQMMKED